MKKTVMMVFFMLIAGITGIASVCAETGVITVGSISDDPKGKFTLFKPFIDYVAHRLGDQEIDTGKVVIVDSMEKMIEQLKSGKVDIFIDSPFPSLHVCAGSGAKPLLRRWKEKVEKYHSILLVKKDSGIESIDDLMGKTIAFKEPYSTSSYFLPKSTLIGMGYKMEEKRDYHEKVPTGVIGYTFSHDDQNTAIWVRKKRVAAGAINGRNLEKVAVDHEKNYRILMKSIDVPRHVVSCRSGLSKDLLSEIEKILINMDSNDEGRMVLSNFANTTKFDRPAEGILRHLEPVDKLMRNVQAEFYGK